MCINHIIGLGRPGPMSFVIPGHDIIIIHMNTVYNTFVQCTVNSCKWIWICECIYHRRPVLCLLSYPGHDIIINNTYAHYEHIYMDICWYAWTKSRQIFINENTLLHHKRHIAPDPDDWLCLLECNRLLIQNQKSRMWRWQICRHLGQDWTHLEIDPSGKWICNLELGKFAKIN